jgi:hypothetical protein
MLFDTWPHALIWLLLHFKFASMSTNAPDIAEYRYAYKLTVYNNLFTGVACGEGQVVCHHSSDF